jgi:hypothetical protein
MQPLTVILGIVFGSVVSVAVSLAIVLLVFGLRSDEDSRYVLEIPELLRAVLMFGLTAIFAGLAFFGSLRAAPWRRWPMAVLCMALTGIGFYYWPGQG